MTIEREDYLVMAVNFNWALLSDIDEEEQTDRVIDRATYRCPWAFGWIKDEKKKTIERCLDIVKRNKLLIEYVPDTLKDRVKKELGL